MFAPARGVLADSRDAGTDKTKPDQAAGTKTHEILQSRSINIRPRRLRPKPRLRVPRSLSFGELQAVLSENMARIARSA
jgi:hypothetical protein